jgi:hypothetical protein
MAAELSFQSYLSSLSVTGTKREAILFLSNFEQCKNIRSWATYQIAWKACTTLAGNLIKKAWLPWDSFISLRK